MSSYKIVYSDNIGDYVGNTDDDKIKNLEEKVNKLLAEGWSCIGGVVITFSEGLTMRMYQTMVKWPSV